MKFSPLLSNLNKLWMPSYRQKPQQITIVSIKTVYELFQSSHTVNMHDCKERSVVMMAPLGSYMHSEMCQSLMLTAKATSGQRSAPKDIG